MIKSTASAPPLESAAPTPASYFVWEFSQKPVAVRLNLDMVDRLGGDVLESFRAITARGSEVGGLLLGRAESGGKTIVESYELFPCDYTRGPLYLLSEEEKARLEDMLRRKKAVPGQAGAVVGFFRSNTRKELALDEEDLELFRKYFARPEQVYLLVKPYAAKASAAGIFIWESGVIRGEASYLEFPFRRSDLNSGEFAKSIVSEAVKLERPPEPAPAAGNRTGARAPVLPFALKRDEEPAVAVPPLQREEPSPIVQLPAKGEDAAAPAARKPVEKAVPAAPARAAEKQEAREEERKTAPAAKAAESAAAAAQPQQQEKPPLSIPGPPPQAGRKMWALFGGLAMLGLAGGMLVYLKSHSAPAAAVVHEIRPLELRAERSNGQVLVTWNRDAESIQAAQRAVLSITDGAQKEDVPLELGQLRGGSIVYTPDPKGSGEVTLRLEVTDGRSGQTRSETVHILAAAAAAGENPDAAKPSPADPNANQAAAQTESAEPAASPDSAASEPSAAAQPQSAASPRRAFSLAARVRTPDAADLPDAPRVAGGAPAGIRPMVPAPATQLAPPPAPKPAPVAAAPAAQAQAPAAASNPTPRVGGKVQEPKLLRKVEPVYPPMARQARVAGTVRMQASIGKDGRIRKVEVLNGPPLLRQAAVDAVQKWVYSPSLLNGSPIESVTDVELNFSLNAR